MNGYNSKYTFYFSNKSNISDVKVCASFPILFLSNMFNNECALSDKKGDVF